MALELVIDVPQYYASSSFEVMGISLYSVLNDAKIYNNYIYRMVDIDGNVLWFMPICDDNRFSDVLTTVDVKCVGDNNVWVKCGSQMFDMGEV